jgi:hypothetical protein
MDDIRIIQEAKSIPGLGTPTSGRFAIAVRVRFTRRGHVQPLSLLSILLAPHPCTICMLVPKVDTQENKLHLQNSPIIVNGCSSKEHRFNFGTILDTGSFYFSFPLIYCPHPRMKPRIYNALNEKHKTKKIYFFKSVGWQ